MTHDPATLAAGAAMSRPTCATCPWWDRKGRERPTFGWCDHSDALLVSPSGETARPYLRGDRDYCALHPAMPAWLAKEGKDGT